MKQGARKPEDKEVEFILPPEKNGEAYVFSADGGKTPLTTTAVTRMHQRIRAAVCARLGAPVRVTSHSERLSLIYWMLVVHGESEATVMQHVPPLEWRHLVARCRVASGGSGMPLIASATAELRGMVERDAISCPFLVLCVVFGPSV